MDDTSPQCTAMIVKLPAALVVASVVAGDGEHFAPTGRVYKEWLAVPTAQCEDWPHFLERAYAFAEAS